MHIIVILRIKVAVKYVSIKPDNGKAEVAELDDVGIMIFLKPFCDLLILKICKVEIFICLF
jgi:hypothetical protein